MIKILIVDDEQPARQRLARLIENINGYQVVAEAANGREAVEQFHASTPDIVLLDIRMPVMDGLEAAQHIMTNETPPAIIFVTAYSDHALEAFNTHAVGYLLKPVRQEKLEQTLQASKRLTRAQTESVVGEARETQEPVARSHICARHRGNLALIAIKDIYYFRAEDKYVALHHSGGEVLIEDSLIKLEAEFKASFIRVHRNALVASNVINGLEKLSDGGHVITLKTADDKIEVSRRHLANVRRFLKQ